LWDESQNFYPRLGGIPHVGLREWRWPRAGRIKFSHLQFDSTVYDRQGAQIALICFDELTHFTAHQFFYDPDWTVGIKLGRDSVLPNLSVAGDQPHETRPLAPGMATGGHG
jgi:hypothetical protein